MFPRGVLVFLLIAGCVPESGYSPWNYVINGPHDRTPAFSPDGNQIAFVHFQYAIPPVAPDYESGLYIVDRFGGGRKLVVAGLMSSPSWSPDGKWLIYSNQGKIQKCRVDGTQITDLTSLDSMTNPSFYFPDWTGEFNLIYFDKPIQDKQGIFMIDSGFQDPRFLQNIGFVARDPELSPKLDKLVFVNAEINELFLSDSLGNNKQQLTTNSVSSSAPTWSPDGEWIAWDYNHRITIIDVTGKNQKFLTYGTTPSWSAQNEIVFTQANQDYSKEVLYVISPKTSGIRQITN